MSIEGRVVRTGSGNAARYRATVGGTRRDGTPIGTREVTSETSDCRRLDDSLVLVIALMIDPDALTPTPPPPPPTPPTTVVTHEVVHERVIIRDIDHEPAAKDPWIIQGALTGTASIARLPGVAPGVGAAMRFGPNALTAFEISFGVLPSQTLDVSGQAVSYTLIEGGLAFCPSVAFGPRVELGGCAGLRLGEIRSQGQGFSTNKEVDRGLADIALGPRFTATLGGPIFALASAAAVVPLVRQETSVSKANGTEMVLDRRSALGAELVIGAGIHFSK